MVYVEFIEKKKFITSEKFIVTKSEKIPVRNWDEIIEFIENVIKPTESAKNEIIDRICKLTINKGFSIAGCKKCNYIRITSENGGIKA